MHDHYAEHLGYGRYRNQTRALCYPYPPTYYDDQDEIRLAMQLAQVLQPRKDNNEDDTDDDSDVEKAMIAHARATVEYEKLKEKLDDAKKNVDECAGKVKAAKKKAKRDRMVYVHY